MLQKNECNKDNNNACTGIACDFVAFMAAYNYSDLVISCFLAFFQVGSSSFLIILNL